MQSLGSSTCSYKEGGQPSCLEGTAEAGWHRGRCGRARGSCPVADGMVGCGGGSTVWSEGRVTKPQSILTRKWLLHVFSPEKSGETGEGKVSSYST